MYGGRVDYAGEIVHGKTSEIAHDSRGIYLGIEKPFKVTRYHSLAGDPPTLPKVLQVTSTCLNGEGSANIIMGVRHTKYAMEGVQFHPESVASQQGLTMFANFLSWNGGTWDTLSPSPVVVPIPGLSFYLFILHNS